MVNFWQFISYLAKCWAYFGKLLTLLDNFSLLQMAKYWKIIQFSGHTEFRKRIDSFLKGLTTTNPLARKIKSLMTHMSMNDYISLLKGKCMTLVYFMVWFE